MEVSTLNNRTRYTTGFFVIAAGIVLLLFLTGSLHLPGAGADDPTPDNPINCAGDIHYHSYDAPSGSQFFGPTTEGIGVDNQYDEMLRRRCTDPVMTVAHLAYETGQWGTPDQLQTKVNTFIAQPEQWNQALNWLIDNEADCSRGSATMSNSYQTLAMQNGSSRSVPPTLFQVTPSRPSFEVLRLDCGNNRVYDYKTNCGIQPVAQEFPNVPTAPPVPPTVTPPTGPPSTSPTTTPSGGKDPSQGINNDPGACSLGDCGPRPVNPTPPPADPVRPTATVAPPRNPPPPPSDPGPTQPPVTSTIPSPITAPD